MKNETLGEKKQRKARNIKRFALCSIILFVVGGGAGYMLTVNPDESTHPLDIVRGTGTNIEELQLMFIGPEELEIRWDDMTGHVLSCVRISGWIKNDSESKTVKFENVACRIKDEKGNIIWEDLDLEFLDRFGPGKYDRYTLGPHEYIDFSVFPICNRAAHVIELSVEEAAIIDP
ncbi:MAG: hypothetical protein HOC20_04310 [Chloroflexi bacterium]|jgi:hypothetical protein|nr:hypothetical protein [Chloroflexota bacterium]